MRPLSPSEVCEGIGAGSWERKTSRASVGGAGVNSSKPDRGEWLNIYPWMSLWYGTLFVVVQGWCELDLTDATVDKLLGHADMVRMLKRFRDGVLHFRSTCWDRTAQEFVITRDASAKVGAPASHGARHALSELG
jgi:hypothetical protein